jgi:hypothetical protein
MCWDLSHRTKRIKGEGIEKVSLSSYGLGFVNKSGSCTMLIY